MAEIIVKTVPERLREAAKLYEERQATYGPTYKTLGAVMQTLYPGGLSVHTTEQWTRLFLLLMCVIKTLRYAGNFLRGGHADSADDLAVYAQMMAETDDEARVRKESLSKVIGEYTKPTAANQTLHVAGGRVYHSVLTSHGWDWHPTKHPTIQPSMHD